jgi:anti-sigma28 factor (negative regulator of flagellin synthesis)
MKRGGIRMKIESGLFTSLFSSKVKKESQSKLSDPSNEPQKIVLEKANFSREAKELSGLFKQLGEDEVGIREEKLKSIKEQLDAGTYNINGMNVIDKLLSRG